MNRPSPTLGMCDLDAAYAAIYSAEPRTYNEGSFALLFMLAHAINARVIMEIGVDHGVSTRALLAALTKLWPQGGGRLYSIEPRRECEAGVRRDLERLRLPVEWVFVPTYSTHCNPAVDGTGTPLDLLYVDGDHSYPTVCSDARRFGPLVRPGGLIVMDDYHTNFPGKVQWLQERWNVLHPIALGPFAFFEVQDTPECRAAIVS